MDEKLGEIKGFRTIDFVCKDRPHDLRYAIDANKINKRIGMVAFGYF
jgi:dTDP-D-glucose 4,6-dehydratase